MGVSAGGLRSLLWLLLLQCDVNGSPDAPHLLGVPNFTNVLQVTVQQGVWVFFCVCTCLIVKRRNHVDSSFNFSFYSPQLEGDERSDEEEDDTDSQKEQKPKPSHVNGSGIRGRANGH